MDHTLPIEILFKILCFLNPLDVIRLRTVSKQIRDITNDLLLWRNLYSTAALPRPPGPYSFQSTQFLENTLVQSARLAKFWTKHPISGSSTKTLRIDALSLVSRVICGRWFLTAEPPKQIVLRDIESGNVHQIVWEDPEQLFSWNACSITLPEGQRVYVTLDRSSQTPGKLLEFSLDGDSGDMALRASFNFPANKNVLMQYFTSNKVPLVCLSDGLMFDVRTRNWYQLSEPLLPFSSVVLTTTHVVIMCYVCPNTIIRAYPVPVPSELNPCPNYDSPRVIRCSHAGTIPADYFLVSLIRNSLYDPINGSVNIRVLTQQTNTDPPRHFFFCLDLTLPQAGTTAGDELPISFGIHDVSMIGPQDSSLLRPAVFVAASDDGHVRGISTGVVPRHTINRGRYDSDVSLMKFTIDASGDQCVAVVGEPSMLAWPNIDHFDGVRGKIYSFGQYAPIRRLDDPYIVRSRTL